MSGSRKAHDHCQSFYDKKVFYRNASLVTGFGSFFVPFGPVFAATSFASMITAAEYDKKFDRCIERHISDDDYRRNKSQP